MSLEDGNYAGIDPGNQGAIAILDADTGKLKIIWDMPLMRVWLKKGVQRDIIDYVKLYEWLRAARDFYNVHTIILETVGGRPRQSASAAFTFGRGYQAILLSAHVLGIAVKHVDPGKWKKDLGVPADKVYSLFRADQFFSLQRMQFRLPDGATKEGRAEAAMIALWWRDYGRYNEKTDEEIADEYNEMVARLKRARARRRVKRKL